VLPFDSRAREAARIQGAGALLTELKVRDFHAPVVRLVFQRTVLGERSHSACSRCGEESHSRTRWASDDLSQNRGMPIALMLRARRGSCRRHEMMHLRQMAIREKENSPDGSRRKENAGLGRRGKGAARRATRAILGVRLVGPPSAAAPAAAYCAALRTSPSTSPLDPRRRAELAQIDEHQDNSRSAADRTRVRDLSRLSYWLECAPRP